MSKLKRQPPHITLNPAPLGRRVAPVSLKVRQYTETLMENRNAKYEEELHASSVGANIEAFTPEHSVLSVCLSLLVEGEEQVLSFQREFGEAAENPNEICVVLSPSQKCSYNPLTKLVLYRNGLGIRFTAEAAKVFGVTSLRLEFSIPDAIFEDFRNNIETLCEGKSFYAYANITI